MEFNFLSRRATAGLWKTAWKTFCRSAEPSLFPTDSEFCSEMYAKAFRVTRKATSYDQKTFYHIFLLEHFATFLKVVYYLLVTFLHL